MDALTSKGQKWTGKEQLFFHCTSLYLGHSLKVPQALGESPDNLRYCFQELSHKCTQMYISVLIPDPPYPLKFTTKTDAGLNRLVNFLK